MRPEPHGDIAVRLYEAYGLAPDFIARLIQVSGNLGVHPFDMANLINHETGGEFSPSTRSPWSSATGLIQFLESTAQYLGTTTDQLAQMTAVEQLDYVEKHLRPYASRINTAQDLQMAVFYPRAIGEPSTYVFPERVRKANGLSTKQEYSDKLMKTAKLPEGTWSFQTQALPVEGTVELIGPTKVRSWPWVAIVAIPLFMGVHIWSKKEGA